MQMHWSCALPLKRCDHNRKILDINLSKPPGPSLPLARVVSFVPKMNRRKTSQKKSRKRSNEGWGTGQHGSTKNESNARANAMTIRTGNALGQLWQQLSTQQFLS